MHGAAAVVGADQLAVATAETLRKAGIEVLELRGDQVADVGVLLSPGSFHLDGRPIAATLLREPIGAVAPATFAVEDWGFVSAELAATWLASTHLDGMLAVNRLDAEAWFEGGQWPVWRRRLRPYVELSPLSFGTSASGSHWLPYLDAGLRPAPGDAVRRTLGTALSQVAVAGSALFVGGEAIGDKAPSPVSRAAEVLRTAGVELVSISHDRDGRVVAVDPYPSVPPDLVEPTACRLAGVFRDHLRPG